MINGAAFTAGGCGLLSIPGAVKPVGILLTAASGYTIYDSGTSAYKAFKEDDSAGLFVNSMNAGLGFLGLYAGTQLMKTPNTSIDQISGSKNTSVTSNKNSNNLPASINLTNEIGKPVAIENLGSTGRVVPHNISEQIAMSIVKNDPLKNSKILTKLSLNDSRWSAINGWLKMERIVETPYSKTTIHFNYNPKTNSFDDFKFKFHKTVTTPKK